MPSTPTFKAQTRTLLGKKVKQLRNQGLIPANVSGNGVESTPLAIGLSAFNKLYQEVGDTGLVYLSVEGERSARPVLIDEVMMNPLTTSPEHVVFRQVNLKEKIEAEIPVEIIGEFSVPDAVLVTVYSSINVEALPTDLPDKFEIDIAGLTEIGQAITFEDLKYDRSKVELLLSEEERQSPVVLVQGHQEEPEETTEEAAEGAETTPEEGTTPAAEGETPAEEPANG